MTSWAGASPPTALVIPVPEVQHQVAGAHIALVRPFLPRHLLDEGVLGELAEFFAELVPFHYVLGEPARFPGGLTYLPPQPGSAFRRIAAEIRRDFPELSGLVTTLESAVPHLVVPEGAGLETPVAAYAREAQLLVDEESPALVLRTFAFGTSAA